MSLLPISGIIIKAAKNIGKKESDSDPMFNRLTSFLEDTKDDWNYITPKEFNKLQEEGKDKDYYIVDLRRPEDFKKGHIQGAHNIFWKDILKESNLSKLPQLKPILLYCYVGHTSSQVLVLLKLLGFDAKSLKFGMGESPVEGVPIAGWKTLKYKVEK